MQKLCWISLDSNRCLNQPLSFQPKDVPLSRSNLSHSASAPLSRRKASEGSALSAAASASMASKSSRFKRAESLRNEHVMFADEISPEDEKFSPVTDKTLEEVAGILQNRRVLGATKHFQKSKADVSKAKD